ncbi:MAG: glutamate-5-semialdehyde dehydrogenase [Chloroflexota bacterium]|jgi:glutamate-5-semialdehyde dehydrogenase
MSVNVLDMAQRARKATRHIANASTVQRNRALQRIAELLQDSTEQATILAANQIDMANAQTAGLRASLQDRMLLNPQRLTAIANDILTVISLPDPVGEVFEQGVLPNGLRWHKVRVPLGVVAVVYEARPNVTFDVATLCLKSGNAAVLRAGKEIVHSSNAIVQLLQRALADVGLPADALQAITDPDRGLVEQLLKLDKYVDVVIPRGGAALHRFCVENATMPVIVGGIGIVHAYIDGTANPQYVRDIVVNGRVQRPSVCNSLDVVLVERAAAPKMVPIVVDALAAHQVELRCDAEAMAIMQIHPHPTANLVPLGPEDYDTEYMALIATIHVVDGVDEAIDHIADHGGHTEVIISQDQAAIDEFVRRVDATAVMVNASTRFNDGGQLGLGAEIAISTQKLHVRGPMGLRELTTYKWVVQGNGTVRK